MQTFRNFLLHLSTIDRLYFDLAKRMAAATLRRHSPPDRPYLLIAAHLLTADPPSTATKTARDVPMVIAIALSKYLGKLPTGKIENSGCGFMHTQLKSQHGIHYSYEQIEKVWNKWPKVMSRAGFTDKDASDFFEGICLMK